MLDFLIYVSLGTLDVLAIIVLGFTIFRLPLWDYKTEIMTFCALIALLSYAFRIHMQAPLIDVLTQIGLLVVFLRYIIHIKLMPSSLIALTGFGFYAITSTVVFLVYVGTGYLSEADVNDAAGSSAYMTQVTAQGVSFLVGYTLHSYKLGFSFIMRPPHNLFVKSPEDMNKFVPILLLVAAIFGLAFFFIMHDNKYLSIPMIVIGLMIIFTMSYRRDKRE